MNGNIRTLLCSYSSDTTMEEISNSLNGQMDCLERQGRDIVGITSHFRQTQTVLNPDSESYGDIIGLHHYTILYSM